MDVLPGGSILAPGKVRYWSIIGVPSFRCNIVFKVRTVSSMGRQTVCMFPSRSFTRSDNFSFDVITCTGTTDADSRNSWTNFEPISLRTSWLREVVPLWSIYICKSLVHRFFPIKALTSFNVVEAVHGITSLFPFWGPFVTTRLMLTEFMVLFIFNLLILLTVLDWMLQSLGRKHSTTSYNI